MEKVLRFNKEKVMTEAQKKMAEWIFMATLGDGRVVRLTACNVNVAACNDEKALLSMLHKCHSVEINKADNYTVSFNYGKYIGNTVFVANYDGNEDELLEALHGAEEVFKPMTAEEQISAWA